MAETRDLHMFVVGPNPATARAYLRTDLHDTWPAVLEPGTNQFWFIIPVEVAGRIIQGGAFVRVEASGFRTVDRRLQQPDGRDYNLIELPSGSELPPVFLEASIIQPAPLPPGPMPPQPPAGNALARRGDFLTLRHPSSSEIIYSSLWFRLSQSARRAAVEAHHYHGYLDVAFDLVYGGDLSGVGVQPFDIWTAPATTEDCMSEIVSAGLRVVPFVGFEDAAPFLAAHGGLDRFSREVMPRAFDVWGHLVSSVIPGVELDEWIDTWDEILLFLERIALCGPWPITPHFRPGRWGPHAGKPWVVNGQARREIDFWRELKQRVPNPLGFAAQYEHSDSGSGFKAGDQTIIDWTTALTAPSRLGGLGIALEANEYAYRQPESESKRLGALAMQHGAIGFMNGGTVPLGGVPGGVDEIDLSEVTWLHRDVSGWPVTSHITDLRIEPARVCIEHTKAGLWPVHDGTEGNPWVFARIGGQWFAGTYEWLRPGQTCKNVTRSDIGPHTKRPPLETWVPSSGEEVAFMVSTRARDGVEAGRERSNIKIIRWP